MTSTTTGWPTDDDQAWGDRLLLRLGLDSTMPAGVADEAVADARAACQESGRPAVELFGEPDAYAREVVRDRVPVEERASVDLEGGTPRSRWTLLLLTAGTSSTVLSVMLLFSSGWTAPVSLAHVVLFAGVLLSWVGALWGLLDRRAGLLRRGWAWWAGAALGIVGSATAAVSLKDLDPLFEMPVLVLLGAAAALVAVAVTRTPPPPQVDEASSVLTVDAWFDRLGGLLRGRYYLQRATVRQQVADARAHWTDSGAPHPHDEFGAPEVYALELLDDSPEPRRGHRLATAWFYTVFAGFWAFNAAMAVLDDDGTWAIVWRSAALVLFVWLAAQTWREHRTDRARPGPGSDPA